MWEIYKEMDNTVRKELQIKEILDVDHDASVPFDFVGFGHESNRGDRVDADCLEEVIHRQAHLREILHTKRRQQARQMEARMMVLVERASLQQRIRIWYKESLA